MYEARLFVGLVTDTTQWRAERAFSELGADTALAGEQSYPFAGGWRSSTADFTCRALSTLIDQATRIPISKGLG